MWQNKDNQLYQAFEFEDFSQAFNFMQEVAKLAEHFNHHPKWQNTYNKVEIWLSTHDANGVTDKDHKLADAIDGLFKKPTVKVEKDEPVRVAKGVKYAKLYADGGSRGNPGHSAGGFVLFDENEHVLFESGKYLGITTNNQAEYHSVKGGVEAARKMGIRNLDVYLDSMLVVNQMKGIYKIRNRDLWPIHDAIKQMIPDFAKVTFTHVPRELNKHADALVNEVLDDYLEQNRV